MLKLSATGFEEIQHCLSYAGQAYLFRCLKPHALARGAITHLRAG